MYKSFGIQHVIKVSVQLKVIKVYDENDKHMAWKGHNLFENRNNSNGRVCSPHKYSDAIKEATHICCMNVNTQVL